MEILGTRQGIHFVSVSKHERVQIEQLLRQFGWQPRNSHSRFDVLPDPDLERLLTG
jgi:hypothetical protein